MLSLLGLMVTVTTTTAGLPTRKQPAHPWAAEPPPAAEMARLYDVSQPTVSRIVAEHRQTRLVHEDHP